MGLRVYTTLTDAFFCNTICGNLLCKILHGFFSIFSKIMGTLLRGTAELYTILYRWHVWQISLLLLFFFAHNSMAQDFSFSLETFTVHTHLLLYWMVLWWFLLYYFYFCYYIVVYKHMAIINARYVQRWLRATHLFSILVVIGPSWMSTGCRYTDFFLRNHYCCART
jgi:hypothetical protein